MNVSTIAMDRDEAREQLRVVRKHLHRRADDEYQALAEALTAAAKGLVLIDVQQAIRDCPTDEAGRPKLAIGRADRKQVRFTWAGGRPTATFRTDDNARRVTSGMVISFDMGREHGRTRLPNRWEREHGQDFLHHGYIEGYALVPMIPPLIREIRGAAVNNDRSNYILWEVDAWADRSILASPPVDPFLLRHVRGTLYAVIAEWELTELERMVMAARAQA